MQNLRICRKLETKHIVHCYSSVFILVSMDVWCLLSWPLCHKSVTGEGGVPQQPIPLAGERESLLVADLTHCKSGQRSPARVRGGRGGTGTPACPTACQLNRKHGLTGHAPVLSDGAHTPPTCCPCWSV